MKSSFRRGTHFAPVSLRVFFIVPFITLIFLTSLAVGYLSFINGQKAVNDVARQLRNEIILRIDQHLLSFLGTPQQIIEINAKAMESGWLDPANPRMLQQHFLQQVQTYPSITSIYYGNSSGGIAGSGRESAQGSLYVYQTAEMKYGSFEKFGVDSQGNPTDLLSTVPKFDSRTRPWYVGATRDGRASWSSVYILFTGQDLAVAASHPVFDGQKKIVGVVSVDIFLSQLSDFLKTLDVGPGGQSFIMERSGLLVASSSNESLFVDRNGAGKLERVEAQSSKSELIREAAKHVDQTLGGFANITSSHQLDFDLGGQRQFLQISPVQDQNGIDWIVVVAIPESGFMSEINANNRTTLFISVIALIIALLVGIFITENMTGRISQLNKSAQMLAQGEWDQQLDTSGQIQELNGLASSYKQMVEQLQSTLKNLKSEIREREQAENALRVSETGLRSYIDHAPNGVFISDEIGNYLETNPAASRITGYSAQQLSTMKINDLVPEAAYAIAVQHFQQVVANGQASGEMPFVHKTGEIRHWSVDAVRLSPERFMGFVQDITERKRNTEMLDVRLKLMEFATTHTLNEILQVTVDKAGTMTGSLIGFYHFVDSDQKTIFLETQPEPSTEAVPKAAGSDNPYSMDQAQVWTDWVSAMKPIVHNDYMGTPNRTGLPAGHSPVRRELVVPILRAGNVVALLGVANKPGDYTDEDVALLNYFADVAWEVAERKQAEENLIQSHDLLENLARLVPGVIYQYRLYPDGRSAFPYSSPGMFQIYGVTPEEVREDATPVFGRLHPDDAQRVSDTISESARTLQTFFCEFRVVLPEQGLRWRWSQAHPERMPDGGTLWHGIISDITEQKQAEAELRQHRDHLEELVEERTTQLVVAKEQAEMANRAKSDFLAVMSHEIRTPLNGVLGLAHLLFQTGLNEKQRNYLANLQVSGEILLATINDILDFSKIESGKLNLELTNFNLDEVLTKLSTNVAYRAQAKNLELVFNIAADVPHQLVGDPMRLGQVLLNLVGNAIKFTSAGDVVVKTSLLRKTSDNVVLEFLVRDTGIGMSAETIGHLFEPFTQADNSTSRKYGGTGLGLTISQRLVQLMRGNITAESQLGKGSVFKFSLQLGYVPGNGIGSQLSAKRVLVVDDNPETLESLESALESFAMQVTVAQSAEIGLELLTQAVPQPVELVLMEWNLAGGLNGLEAIQRMRRDPEQRHIPAILLISAEEMVPPAEDGELDGYLVKPITHSQLYDALVQVLRPDKSQAIRPQAQLISQEAMEKLEGGRILLVEDNQINQLVARDLLESMGLQVFIADNGEQAVEMVKIGHYDVVLMDIQMPGMDGYEATALIRQDQRGEDNRLPIIAMTAHALESDRQKTLDAGLDDYISKPVDVTKLANVLIRWVHAGPGNVEPKPVTVNQISDAAGVRYRVSPELTREVAPQPVTDELPESLAFFDLKSALARLGGNKELYLRLLQLFYADHAQDGQTIQTALTRTDMNYARLLAHSLKGVASVIGATELSVAASVLEMAIVRENAFFYDEFLLQLELRLADVIHSIETLTRPTQSSGESES